jgi:flagellar hook assembly protein FlgD
VQVRSITCSARKSSGSNTSKFVTAVPQCLEYQYTITSFGPVTLRIVSTSGRVVKNIVNKYQGAGSYNVKCDGKDERGRNVVSGVYLYQLITPKATITGTINLIR